MISASLPVIVTLPEPLLLNVAEALAVTFKIPLETLITELAMFPSISVVLIPVIPVAVSSTTVCKPGTVFSGASFTLVTFIATVSVSLNGVPSLSVETILNVSEPM